MDMVKRKKGVRKKQNPVKKDLNLFQKEINQDIVDVVRIARRKFFKRLLKVILLVIILYLLMRWIQ